MPEVNMKDTLNFTALHKAEFAMWNLSKQTLTEDVKNPKVWTHCQKRMYHLQYLNGQI